MTDTKYNGWTNYETWAVALWIDNEESSQNYWREQAAKHLEQAPGCEQVWQGVWTVPEAARFNLADALKEQISEDSPLDDAGLYTDLLNAALSEVNWSEIAANILDEIEAPNAQ